MVLWAVFVKGGKVHTHAKNLCIFLWNKRGVCYPGSLLYFYGEVGGEESVDFFTDGLAVRLREASEGLLDWPSPWVYFKSVLGEFPGYAWHVCWTPGKNFLVLTEEFDECAFLCRG